MSYFRLQFVNETQLASRFLFNIKSPLLVCELVPAMIPIDADNDLKEDLNTYVPWAFNYFMHQGTRVLIRELKWSEHQVVYNFKSLFTKNERKKYFLSKRNPSGRYNTRKTRHIRLHLMSLRAIAVNGKKISTLTLSFDYPWVIIALSKNRV